MENSNLLDPLLQQPDESNPINPLTPTVLSPNKTPIGEQLEGAYGNEFTKGFRRGALGMVGTSQAAVAGFIDPVFPNAAKKLFDDAKQILDFEPGLRPKVETWDQVKDPTTFGQYAASKMGEGAPSTLASFAGAGAGAAGALGLRALGVRGATAGLGSTVGGTAAMFAPEAGETALNLQEDPVALANTGPWERAGVAAIKGGVNAALENLPERLAIGRAFQRPVGKAGVRGILGSTAAGAGEAAVGEALTEGAQEITGNVAQNYANPQQEIWNGKNIREAMLGGAFGGLGFGAAGGAIHGIRSNLAAGADKAADVTEKSVSKVREALQPLIDELPDAPTPEEVTTFIRRASQEPEFLGESVRKGADKAWDVAKAGARTLGDLAAIAGEKGAKLIDAANEVIGTALVNADKLDKPGETVNRDWLLGLQLRAHEMTGETYNALYKFATNPTDKQNQIRLGIIAETARQDLSEGAKRSADFVARAYDSFVTGSVDQKAKASLDWTDAKKRKYALVRDDPKLGLPFRLMEKEVGIARAKAVFGMLTAMNETPELYRSRFEKQGKRVQGEMVNPMYEALTNALGQDPQAYQQFFTNAQEAYAAKTEKDEAKRIERLKKMTPAQRELAMALEQYDNVVALAPNADNQQIQAAMLKAAEGRKAAAVDAAEEEKTQLESEQDASEEAVMEGTMREGTQAELEPPMDTPITHEEFQKAISNFHYFRGDNPFGDRPQSHIMVRLTSDPDDPNPLSAKQLAALTKVPDDSDNRNPKRRGLTATEKGIYIRDNALTLPMQPYQLAMILGKPQFTKHAAPMRPGQTGGSNSRKADVFVNALTTMLTNGITITDSKGQTHKLQVDIDSLPENLILGKNVAQGSREKPYTVADWRKETQASIFDTPAQNKTLQEVAMRYAPLEGDSSSMFNGLKEEAKSLSDRLKTTKGDEREAVARESRAIKKFGSTLTKNFRKELRRLAAESNPGMTEEELDDYVDSSKVPQDMKNAAFTHAARVTPKEVLANTLRSEVWSTLTAVRNAINEKAYDRLDASGETPQLIEDFMLYLGTNGEQVPGSIIKEFAEQQTPLLTKKVLDDPALISPTNGKTPQQSILEQLNNALQVAKKNFLSGIFDEGSIVDIMGMMDDAETPEVLGLGNNPVNPNDYGRLDPESRLGKKQAEEKELGPFYRKLTEARKQEMLSTFVLYKQRLNTFGKWRMQLPDKRANAIGYFQTKKDAEAFLDNLPEDGFAGLRIKITGDDRLYTPAEAQERYGKVKVTEEGRTQNGPMSAASIINPDTGEHFQIGNHVFKDMPPEHATQFLTRLTKLLKKKSKARIIDGTPMDVVVEPQPVQNTDTESDEEYAARFEEWKKNNKPKRVPLTYARLEELLQVDKPFRTYDGGVNEYADRQLEFDDYSFAADKDELAAGEAKLSAERTAAEKAVSKVAPQRTEDSAPLQGEMFQQAEIQKEKAPYTTWRHYPATAPGFIESSMNPRYLTKRSVVRYPEKQEPARAAEKPKPKEEPKGPKSVSNARQRYFEDPLTESSEPTAVTDDFGNQVRVDYRGKIVTPGQGKSVVTASRRTAVQEAEGALPTPPSDQELSGVVDALRGSLAPVSLSENKSEDYRKRTARNALSTDATWAVAFDFGTGGERYTASVARDRIVQTKINEVPIGEVAAKVVAFLKQREAELKRPVKTLNIAGNGLHNVKKIYPNRTDEELQARYDRYVLAVMTEVVDQYPELQEIRSGGQTGADEAGAKAGIALGIPTSVHMPAGFKIRLGDGTDITQTREQAMARYQSVKPPEKKKAAPPKSVVKPQRPIEEQKADIARLAKAKEKDDARYRRELVAKKDQIAEALAAPQPPTIVKAVVRLNGQVYEDTNHFLAIQQAKKAGWKFGDKIEGDSHTLFRLSDGRIVEAAEAQKIGGGKRSEDMKGEFGEKARSVVAERRKAREEATPPAATTAQEQSPQPLPEIKGGVSGISGEAVYLKTADGDEILGVAEARKKRANQAADLRPVPFVHPTDKSKDDPNAIQVFNKDGEMQGYVPKGFAAVLTPKLAEGSNRLAGSFDEYGNLVKVRIEWTVPAKKNPRLAFTDKDNVIHLVLPNIDADYGKFDYMFHEGEGASDSSKQKAAVFEAMGITKEIFAELIFSKTAYKTFLLAHEKAHVDNNDYANYPRKADGKPDYMHKDALRREALATLAGIQAVVERLGKVSEGFRASEAPKSETASAPTTNEKAEPSEEDIKRYAYFRESAADLRDRIGQAKDRTRTPTGRTRTQTDKIVADLEQQLANDEKELLALEKQFDGKTLYEKSSKLLKGGRGVGAVMMSDEADAIAEIYDKTLGQVAGITDVRILRGMYDRKVKRAEEFKKKYPGHTRLWSTIEAEASAIKNRIDQLVERQQNTQEDSAEFKQQVQQRMRRGYRRDEAEHLARLSLERKEPAPDALTNDEKAERSMPEDTRVSPEETGDEELDRFNKPHAQPRLIRNFPMSYVAYKGELRDGLNEKYPTGSSMLGLIKGGDRTATTRGQFEGARKGDIIMFPFNSNRYVVVGFERVKFDKAGREKWEQREGWNAAAANRRFPNQVRTGAIQMIFRLESSPAAASETPQATSAPAAPQSPSPAPSGEPTPPKQQIKDSEFVGPPTKAEAEAQMQRDQQAQAGVPVDVPQRLTALIEKMFGKKVQIIIGEPPKDSKAKPQGEKAWYVGRQSVDEYTANKRKIQAARANRRKALDAGDRDGAQHYLEQEQELQKHTQVLGLIYLSPSLNEREQLSALYHESVHAAFDILLNQEERAVLATAFSRGMVRNRLRQIYKDEPTVLAHIDSDPEEAAAYGFEIYAASPEMLQLGGKVTGIFEKIAEFFRKLLNIATPEEKAKIVMNSLLSGDRNTQEMSSLPKVLDKDQGIKDRAIKMSREVAKLIIKGWNIVADNLHDRLIDTENPAIAKIAELGYTKTGSDKRVGMVHKMLSGQTEWVNRLDKAMKKYPVEVLKRAAEAKMLKKIPPTTDTEARAAYDDMGRYFDSMHRYMIEAIREGGVEDPQFGYEKDYYPMVWDAEKVLKEREKFLTMIQKPEYTAFLEDLRVTPTELWENISGYVTRGESFQGVMNKNTGEPINEYAKERSLSFIKPEDRREFMQDDPVHTLLHYTKQMVRQAEYIRAYGKNGARLHQLKQEAEKKYGATKEQLELVDDYIDGLLGNKEVGMSRELKDTYGAMIVYQNFRLLPFNLFSSLVDPLGVAIRSNNLGDAFETFGYAIKNVFRDLKSEREDNSKDVWEKLAEDWGIIEDAGVLSNLHNMYESVELRGFSKRMNDALFKYNLLNGWTRNTKIMATKAAQRFMFRAAQGHFGAEQSARYLEELGVSKSDIVADQQGNMALTKAQLISQGVSEAQAEQIEKRLKDATVKFVNQAILNPTAGDLPNWGSNPYFAPIFHLKQFMFTFQSTIGRRITHEAANGNYKPMWLSTIYIPGMIGADMLRGFASNFGDEPPWQKNWGVTDYLLHGVDRSGLLGAGSLLTGMKDDMMHGGQGYETLAGPSVEQLKKGLVATQTGGEKMQNFIVKSMPLNPIYDQWLVSSGGVSPG